jgi:hypothetical protein
MLAYSSATTIPAPIVSAASRYTRVVASAPIRELPVVEALGRARLPVAGRRPVYHRARQGQWVASVLRDNPGYRLERWSGGAVATATADAPNASFEATRLNRRIGWSADLR